MENNYLIYINLFLTLSLGLLSIDAYNKDESGKKKIKNQFLLVISITVLLFGSGVWQISQETKKENENENKLKKLTEAAEKKADDRYIKFSQQLAEAMKKQELKIDTQSRTIINLSDTLSKIKLKQLPTDPIIAIQKEGIDFEILDDSLSFYVGIIAFQNAANIIQLNCIIEAILSEGLDTLLTKNILVYNNITIPQDNTATTLVGMRQGRQISELVTNVNFYFYGTYKSLDTEKIIKFKEVYTYSLKTKETGSFKTNIRDSLFNQEFVLKSGLLKLN